MPRHRELKAVAHNMLESFLRRYNEVEGYWGLGKLYRHALRHQVLSVEINLLERCIAPDYPEFRAMVFHFSDRLTWQLERGHLPLNWVQKAGLTVRFNVPVQRGHAVSVGRGKPFEARLEIEDDRGKIHAAQRLGWCAPHDPTLEHRSGRA